MSEFVLVHGACHGGWCWRKLLPILKGLGHTVHCPDLPGHGADDTALSEVSLRGYAERIVQTLREIDTPEVVLVGHSLGGMVISSVASLAPERIHKLVFLAAFLPQAPVTVHQLVAGDNESLLFDSFEVDAGGAVATLKPEAIVELFYNDCSPSDIEFARANLVAAAMRPNDEMAPALPSAWEHHAHYIECAQDHAISLAAQRRMHSRLPPNQVWTLDTGHSPHFSAPAELADVLDKISRISR